MTAPHRHHSNQLATARPGILRRAGRDRTADRSSHSRPSRQLPSIAETAAPADWRSGGPPGWLFRLGRRLPQMKRLDLAVADEREFFRLTLPAIVLARFFGTPTRIRLLSARTEPFLLRIGRIGRAGLRLAEEIQTTSARATQVLSRFAIPGRTIREPLNLAHVPSRTVKRVQPRILVYTSDAWRQDFVAILGAFEAIKSKYPRAELVVAGPDIRAEGVVGGALIQSGLIRRRLDSFDEFIELCQESDVFLATNSIDITPRPLLAAMAAGLPAIIPPLGDIRPSTIAALVRHEESTRVARGRIVDAIIDLVEKPDLSQELSAYSLRTVREYVLSCPLRSRTPDWRLTA